MSGSAALILIFFLTVHREFSFKKISKLWKLKRDVLFSPHVLLYQIVSSVDPPDADREGDVNHTVSLSMPRGSGGR